MGVLWSTCSAEHLQRAVAYSVSVFILYLHLIKVIFFPLYIHQSCPSYVHYATDTRIMLNDAEKKKGDKPHFLCHLAALIDIAQGHTSHPNPSPHPTQYSFLNTTPLKLLSLPILHHSLYCQPFTCLSCPVARTRHMAQAWVSYRNNNNKNYNNQKDNKKRYKDNIKKGQ